MIEKGQKSPAVLQRGCLALNFLLGFLLSLAFSLCSVASASQKAIVKAGTTVHGSPFITGEKLGTYKARTTVTLADQPEEGWYKVMFPHEVKGFKEGWVSNDSIERFLTGFPQARQAEQPTERHVERRAERRVERRSERYSESQQRRKRYSDEPAYSKSDFKKYRFFVGPALNLHMASPSSFQTKIGTPQESVTYLSYGAEFGLFFGDAVLGWSKLSRYSMSGQSDAYSASGLILLVGADYAFFRQMGWTIGAGIGLGLGLSSAGNNNGIIQKTTSGIMEPLYQFRSIVDYQFSDSSFSVRGELGYRIMNLTAVPVTAPLTVTASTADLSLSGFFFGLAGLFHF